MNQDTLTVILFFGIFITSSLATIIIKIVQWIQEIPKECPEGSVCNYVECEKRAQCKKYERYENNNNIPSDSEGKEEECSK